MRYVEEETMVCICEAREMRISYKGRASGGKNRLRNLD